MLSRRIFQAECLMAALKRVRLSPIESAVILRPQADERYPFLALMGGRSILVFARQLDVVEKEGNWDDLAEGVVARLRRAHSLEPPESLTRADVNREVLAELTGILSAAGHDVGTVDLIDDHVVLTTLQQIRSRLTDAAYVVPSEAVLVKRNGAAVALQPSEPFSA